MNVVSWRWKKFRLVIGVIFTIATRKTYGNANVFRPQTKCTLCGFLNNPSSVSPRFRPNTGFKFTRLLLYCHHRHRPSVTKKAVHITAGPLYTAVDCRRSSFSCRSCPHLERPAAPRQARIISVFRSRLKTHLFRRSFPWLLFSACEVTLDTLVLLFYLLTYLHMATV